MTQMDTRTRHFRHKPVMTGLTARPASTSTQPTSKPTGSAVAGFTLVELVVAMAVALIVMGIIVVGLRQALGGSKIRATRATLETVRSMLGDFTADPQNRNRFFRQILSSQTGFGSTAAVTTPGSVIVGSGGATPDLNVGNENRNGRTMDSSRRVINLLLSSSSNRALVDSLPSDVVERETATRATASQSDRTPASAVVTSSLLDAWNNPILFVPDGFEDASGSVIGSGGLAGVTSTTFTGTQTIRAPDRKPFFASAGPDGNFTTHDDNVYSFQN